MVGVVAVVDVSDLEVDVVVVIAAVESLDRCGNRRSLQSFPN